jgi:hypothetical protein
MRSVMTANIIGIEIPPVVSPGFHPNCEAWGTWAVSASQRRDLAGACTPEMTLR